MSLTEYYFWLFALLIIAIFAIAGITMFINKKLLKR